ncbi:MAG: hypothetical protein GY940_39190 [bacterium]|nr:hypothetical protein [bacterium]
MDSNKAYTWTLIETRPQLERFCRDNNTVDWLAFDTEFIPERYYRSKLCLISVATPKGNFVIDVIKTLAIDPFIRLLEDPRILKITHAGENDYRILVLDYHVKPKNIFDTQLSYGFLDYDYPLGLQLLVRRELGLRISKVELKSDWEKRPLTPKQLDYAVRDVIYLYPLMQELERKLEKSGKLEWAMSENQRWERPGSFRSEPVDYFSGLSLKNLSKKQKVFLLRLHHWRRQEARKINRPLGGVLKTRYIKSIVKSVAAGKEALLSDRTLPDGMLHRLWSTFHRLYHREIDAHEKQQLAQLPVEENDTPHHRIMMEMLHQLIKLKAAVHSISPALIISKKEINKMKADPGYHATELQEGWRRHVLGGDLLQWIIKRNPIDAVIEGSNCILTMRESRLS